MYGVLFQCYVSVAILDGKVSPKVWWVYHFHKWLMHAYEREFDSWHLGWDGALGIGQVSYILLSHGKVT